MEQRRKKTYLERLADWSCERATGESATYWRELCINRGVLLGRASDKVYGRNKRIKQLESIIAGADLRLERKERAIESKKAELGETKKKLEATSKMLLAAENAIKDSLIEWAEYMEKSHRKESELKQRNEKMRSKMRYAQTKIEKMSNEDYVGKLEKQVSALRSAYSLLNKECAVYKRKLHTTEKRLAREICSTRGKK